MHACIYFWRIAKVSRCMYGTIVVAITFTLLSSTQITFVDFALYELLDQHRLFDASLLDGFDNIKVCHFV